MKITYAKGFPETANAVNGTTLLHITNSTSESLVLPKLVSVLVQVEASCCFGVDILCSRIPSPIGVNLASEKLRVALYSIVRTMERTLIRGAMIRVKSNLSDTDRRSLREELS